MGQGGRISKKKKKKKKKKKIKGGSKTVSKPIHFLLNVIKKKKT